MVELGVNVTAIHKTLIFNQAAWLKPYIEFNINIRKMAKNDFEKDFYKLMNDSVFGKTMENVKNRIDLRLAVDEKKKKIRKYKLEYSLT